MTDFSIVVINLLYYVLIFFLNFNTVFVFFKIFLFCSFYVDF